MRVGALLPMLALAAKSKRGMYEKDDKKSRYDSNTGNAM
jgi:hypothetical protein